MTENREKLGDYLKWTNYSVWNCLLGHALKRFPGINRECRVLHTGPGLLSSATWPLMPIQVRENIGVTVLFFMHTIRFLSQKKIRPAFRFSSNTAFKWIKNHLDRDLDSCDETAIIITS